MGFLTEMENESRRAVVSEEALDDLMLTDFMHEVFSRHTAGQPFTWKNYLTVSEQDIIYRRDVLRELAVNPELIEKMQALCACIQMVSRFKDLHMEGEYGPEAFREFGIMQEAYIQISSMQEALQKAIDDKRVVSQGLVRLCGVLQDKLRENFSPNFTAEWAKRTSGLERMGSVCVEFHLDDELHIHSASILAIHKQKYGRGGLLQFKRDMVHPEHPWELAGLKDMETPTEELLEGELKFNQRRFYQILSRMTLELDGLYQDLIFYLGAMEYCARMTQAGVSLCLPQILPMEHRGFRAVGMVNPVLALLKKTGKPVPNDVDFAEGGEIFLLTGINQGGKTTFLRTVGAVQLLFQLGWPVPASQTAISPVDKIVTVFSHEENTALQHGKLGQELKTVRRGMEEATPQSLLLCNEPITGTSPMENLYLSRVVLSACKVNGYKGIWVTHLYDLASRAEAMNQELGGSRISSLVAKAVVHEDTVDASYHIERGEPAFTSYAREVMRKEAAL